MFFIWHVFNNFIQIAILSISTKSLVLRYSIIIKTIAMKRITTIALACLCATATQAQKIKELSAKEKQVYSKQDSVTVMTSVGSLKLPPPYATESVTFRHVMADWPEGELPKVPAGFKVERLAADLKNPRTTYVAPNGDLFVTESNTFNSADRITILRDADKNGSYEVKEVFAENLKLPFGTLIVKDRFYVALLMDCMCIRTKMEI